MSTEPARLVAIVGVCDEIEIIGRCLDHLERQGVESIVVVDMLSRDGTRELLRQRRDAGRIALVERDNGDAAEAAHFGVECARRLWNPTWIMLQDADEFCLAASGDLRQAIASRPCGVFQIPRFNACLCSKLLSAFAEPGALAVGTLDLWAGSRRLSREAMDQDPSVRWSAARPAPKVVAAADLIAAVAPGGHAILDEQGNVVPAATATDLLVVHVPFLSFARFAKKMARAKDLIAGNRSYFKGTTGWHWHRWVEILDSGALEEEYRRQYLDDADLIVAARAGAVRRADSILAERGSEVIG